MLPPIDKPNCNHFAAVCFGFCCSSFAALRKTPIPELQKPEMTPVILQAPSAPEPSSIYLQGRIMPWIDITANNDASQTGQSVKGSFGEPRDKATKVEFGSEATRPVTGLEGIFGAPETTQREEIQILGALEEQVRESSNRNGNQPAAVFGTTCSTAEPPQSSERIRDEDLPDTQQDPFDQSIALEPSLNTQFWAEINKKTEGNHRDPTTSLLINFTAQHSNNFNTDTCENSNQSIPQYSYLNRQNSDQLALNEQLDYTGSSATQIFALAHKNIKELLRERLESPGRSSASESPGFSSQHLVYYLPDTQKDPSDLPSHSPNWTAENFNQVVPETHVSCAPPSFFAKQDSPLFASLSGLNAPIEASRKLSCRERKRLIVPMNRPVNVTSAMKAWATRTFYSLDPFREDEDCWFHPSPPPGVLNGNGCLRPYGKIQKKFTWKDHNGKHSIVLNFGIVSKLLLNRLTKQQKDGFISNKWHLSHLCGNWTCLNPEHTTVEPGSTNISRNICFSHRSGCGHSPPCMKDKKIFLNADGKRADPGCFIPQLQGVASEASEGQVGYNHSLHWFDDSEDHMTTDETEEPEATRIGPAN